MEKVVLQGHIVIPPEELAEVKAAMLTHSDLTQQEAGCLVFEMTEDDSDTCRYNLYEEFIDRKAFQFHQERARNSEWGKITGNVERHFQITGLD